MGSPDVNVMVSESADDIGFLSQSRILTENVADEPTFSDTGEAGYTSEYQEFAVPEAVVQLEFPELLFPKVTLGLWL